MARSVPLYRAGGGVKVTNTPWTGLPFASRTGTDGAVRGVPGRRWRDCVVVVMATMFCAVVAVLVALKVTVVMPVAVAVTVFAAPAVRPRFHVESEATPALFETTVGDTRRRDRARRRAATAGRGEREGHAEAGDGIAVRIEDGDRRRRATAEPTAPDCDDGLSARSSSPRQRNPWRRRRGCRAETGDRGGDRIACRQSYRASTR